MKKIALLTLAFTIAVAQALAADITLSTDSRLSKAFDMTTYTAVLNLVSAAGGTGSFDFSTDGSAALAGLFTEERPGTIMSIKVDLGEGALTPTTLFDVYLYDGSSTLKQDLLGATGANLVVTAGTILYVRNSDGSVTYQPLTSPPILTVENAGAANTATFTVVIASDPIR